MLLRARRFNLPTNDAFSTMQREMENLFGHVMCETSDQGTKTRGWYAPVAVWSDADKIFLEFEVPGVTKDSIDVTIHKGVLHVSGERKVPEGDRTYLANDRVYGKFDRTINLPEDVDADSIDAQLNNGVLHVVLSKHPEVQPKKITVRD